MRAKSTEKYERALKLALKQPKPSKEVYDLLLAADNGGDGRATYALATWHLFGSPFTKINLRLANAMLKRAADKGVADAAHDLAISYEKGLGIGKSLLVLLSTMYARHSWATRSRTMKSGACIFMESALSETEGYVMLG
jgi:TPR repeat protein